MIMDIDMVKFLSSDKFKGIWGDITVILDLDYWTTITVMRLATK